MDEQIDKQLENAQPKGPFWFSKYLRYVSWDRAIGVLMIGAIIVYAKSGAHASKVMGPQKPVVKQEIVKQEIVEQSTAQVVPARYQAGTGYTPISSQPGYEPQPERTEPTAPQQTPADVIKAARLEKVLKGAFASSIAVSEGGEQVKEETEKEAVETAQTSKPEDHPNQTIIPEGTEIPAITLGAINGEMAGPVDAETRSNVYLPGTREIVIPQGAKLLGLDRKSTRLNQQRL